MKDKVGEASSMHDMRNVYKILVGKLEMRRRCWREDDIKSIW
jgi:hypothetical protein